MNDHTRFGRLVAAMLLLTLTTRGAAGADAKDFEAREYKDGDRNVLLYQLFKPKDYDSGKKYPLILFLHGAGERGNNNTSQVRDALYWARDSVQGQQAAFVLAPQCPGTRQAFAVYGTGKQFDQSFNDYGKAAAREWKAYKIPLAKLPTGQKHYLSLINSSDAKAATRASAEFRNIRVYKDGAAAVSPILNLEKLVFARKEGSGTAKKSENDGSTIALDGDIRIKAALEYTVTAKTVLEFEFRSTAQGTSHAIALDTDDFFDYRWANMDWAAKKGSAGKEPSTPLRLTLEVLGQLRKEFSLDERRLYITGLSMGGYGTWDAIERQPTLFAAAVPVCGGGDEALAARIKDIPIWCFHGGADNVVPVVRSRNMVEALKAAGGAPRYTEYPGVGHNSWDKAYSEPELAGWLFAQMRD